MKRSYYLKTSAIIALFYLSACSSQQLQNDTNLGLAAANQVFELKDPKHFLQKHQSKILVLHFFSTWCTMCQHEMRALSQFSTLFDKSDVTFAAVAVYDHEDSLRTFLTQNKFDFPIYFDQRDTLASVYNIHEIPLTLIFDASGKQRALQIIPGALATGRLEGPQPWDSMPAVRALQGLLRE